MLKTVVADYSAHGQVTAADYEDHVMPAVEAVLMRHEKVRLLYQLGADFHGFDAGALCDDSKVGLSHLAAWERIALVTDIGWLRGTTKAMGFMMPGQVRVLTNTELETARNWLVS
ncbi:SpoIIAA family protein [Thiohalocapsa halophila]